MKNFIFLVALLLCSAISYAQDIQKQAGPQVVIKEVFDAFSEADFEKMKRLVTVDVKILEHGVVWNLDSIKYYFEKPRPADFKRVNQFDFFQTEISGDMAFVSYHNRADIQANKKQRTIKWLESAVIVKEGGQWKLKMLHSTRIPN